MPIRRLHRDIFAAVDSPSAARNAAEALASWFATSAGRALAEREGALLRDRARRFHGDCLLMLGPMPAATAATSRCMVRARLYAAPRVPHRPLRDVTTLVAAPQALPLAANSVDGVVLHHALEYAPDPRAAVREVARVVRPGGRLLVCAFNPLSLWCLSALRRRTNAVTAWRLNDWLAVLGFRDARTAYLNLRVPLQWLKQPRWAAASRWLERKSGPMSGVYLTFATKEAFGAAPQAAGLAADARRLPALSAAGAAKIAVFSPSSPDDCGIG